MDDGDHQVCELHRLDDASVLGDVARALERHGIEAAVWPERGRRLTPWAADMWRLMVHCRSLVHARWVAAQAGLDTWAADEDGDAA